VREPKPRRALMFRTEPSHPIHLPFDEIEIDTPYWTEAIGEAIICSELARSESGSTAPEETEVSPVDHCNLL
jgi:hypothetical protein